MTPAPPRSARLTLHVQPKARRTEVAGWHGDAIKVRVAAPPSGGAANAALVRFLADRLGMPPSSVSLAAGAGGRRKRVVIEGLDTDEAVRRLGV